MSEPCTKCPLGLGCTTNLMAGKGPSGGIMIVGEAPGAAEDALGEPFVGRSGQLLRAMLTDAGVDPSTVRYTNAVRCRPKKNRKPTPKEVNTCREYLLSEIALHRPSQIVPVGDVALRAVLRLSGITRHRGQRFEFDAALGNAQAPEYVPIVLPTLHPAFVLRTPALYDTVVSDLKQLHHPLRRESDSADDTELGSVRFTQLVDGEELPRGLVRPGAVVAWDVETSYWQDGGDRVIQWAATVSNGHMETTVCSADPVPLAGLAAYAGPSDGIPSSAGGVSSASGLRGVQRGVGAASAVFPGRSTGNRSSAELQCQDPHVPGGARDSGFAGGVEFVTHNGWQADIPWMAKMGYPMPRGRDTMVLAYLMDETQPLGLEPLAMRYLGVAGWKDEGHTAAPGSPEFALYNARDALYTARLYKIFKGELGERIKVADHIIGPGQQALAACSARGLRVSLRAVEEAERFYSDRAGAARHDLELWGIENPNATRQLTDCLVSQGYDLTEKTETGELRLDKEVLSKLPQTPLVGLIREYKFAEKRRQMVEPYRLAALSEDGRVHPEYTVVRTATGRTSARKPNVQQVARDPIMRAMLPGGQADYSAIEFRLAAWIAREEGVLERFRQDPFWDPHRWFAALYYNILEKEVTDDQRQVAKSANFGLLFKALPPTLVDYTRATTGIVLSLAEATRIRRAWLAALPGFPKWWERTERFIAKHGYVESPTGRRRHFGPPEIVRRSYKLAEFVREGVNAQVQGFAADVALLGLHGAHVDGLPITGFYHDAISFDTEVEPQAVARCMLEVPKKILGDRFGIDLDIPLAIELKQGDKKWILAYSSDHRLIEKYNKPLTI